MSLPAYKAENFADHLRETPPTTYLRRTHCPICDAPTSRATAEMQSQSPAEHSPPEAHINYFPTEKSHRPCFTYARCGDCGGLYCPVYFRQDQLNQLYAQQNENQIDVPLSSRAATQRAYVEVIQRFAPLEGDYLELGPDIGLFTEAVAKAGRFGKFYLYEPNLAVHDALSDRMKGHDIRLSNELYRTGLVPPASLSLAVIIHALDHLLDPATILRAVYDDLKPGGSVLIVTHDEGSPLARMLGRRWPPYNLQHPQLFRRSSMKRLVERCGFKVTGFGGTANYFPAHFLVQKALGLAGLDGLVKGWTKSPDLRLQLGNLGTVCQKPH